MELVKNGYPGAAYTFKVEHVRDQFIQGVTISDDIREKFLMSQLAKLGEAVFVAREFESARSTCRAVPTIEKKKAKNVARLRWMVRRFQMRLARSRNSFCG